MQTIGQIAVDDRLTPFVAAFNALRPPAEMVPPLLGHEVMVIRHVAGPRGPEIRILPAAELLRRMADALDEMDRLLDPRA